MLLFLNIKQAIQTRTGLVLLKIGKLFTVFFENHDFCKIQQLILTEKKETKLIVETLKRRCLSNCLFTKFKCEI